MIGSKVFVRCVLILIGLSGICSVPVEASDHGLYISKIKVPSGFSVGIYAESVPGARSLTLGPRGVVFVGSRREGNVYALVDNDGDGKAEKKWVIRAGLKMPNGVAYRNGNLYVAEVNRILKFENMNGPLRESMPFKVVFSGLPSETHHGWKFIAFGPDNKLYIPVGAPCNICLKKDPRYAAIHRLDVKSGKLDLFAKGIRNSVGFAWHPKTKELWFTDNGRDWLGDNSPPDELNWAPKKGLHFGFPFCHGNDILDPKFGTGKECKYFTPPGFNFEAHVASLGMRFYRGGMFPEKYKNQILVAQHGSWNRSKKIGYRVVLVTLKGNIAVKKEVFASGWLGKKEKVFGRPVDVLELPDGSLLVSDDYADVVYRISYKE